MTKTLREHAAEQLEAFTAEYGAPDDREHAIDRWMRRLIETGDVPNDILEALPEVSRHNEPQIGPQEYECGCVAMTGITDRDCRTWRGYDDSGTLFGWNAEDAERLIVVQRVPDAPILLTVFGGERLDTFD